MYYSIIVCGHGCVYNIHFKTQYRPLFKKKNSIKTKENVLRWIEYFISRNDKLLLSFCDYLRSNWKSHYNTEENCFNWTKIKIDFFLFVVYRPHSTHASTISFNLQFVNVNERSVDKTVMHFFCSKMYKLQANEEFSKLFVTLIDKTWYDKSAILV